jgi:hypothetical protein
MNRNENEAESFAGNFVAFGEEALFFEVPSCRRGFRNDFQLDSCGNVVKWMKASST